MNAAESLKTNVVSTYLALIHIDYKEKHFQLSKNFESRRWAMSTTEKNLDRQIMKLVLEERIISGT